MTSVELLIYIGILNIQEFNITHCDKKQNLRKSLFFFSQKFIRRNQRNPNQIVTRKKTSLSPFYHKIFFIENE